MVSVVSQEPKECTSEVAAMPSKKSMPVGADVVYVNNCLPHTQTFRARAPGKQGVPGPLLYHVCLKLGENVLTKEEWDYLKKRKDVQTLLEQKRLTTGRLGRFERNDLYHSLTGTLDRSLIKKLSVKSRKIIDDQLLDKDNLNPSIFAAQQAHGGTESALKREFELLKQQFNQLLALHSGDPSAGATLVEET